MSNHLLEIYVQYLNTALLSFLPISELRGSIPYGLSHNLSLPIVFTLSVIANILVVPIFIWFLDKINPVLLNLNWYNKFYHNKLEKTRNRIKKHFEKYEYLGLMIFVSIPLPFTGAYTGTLGAWALGLNRKKSILYISLGVVIAGTIISIIAHYSIHALYLFFK